MFPASWLIQTAKMNGLTLVARLDLNTKEDRQARPQEKRASQLWFGPFMTMERKWAFVLRGTRNHHGFGITRSDLCFQKISVAIKTEVS